MNNVPSRCMYSKVSLDFKLESKSVMSWCGNANLQIILAHTAIAGLQLGVSMTLGSTSHRMDILTRKKNSRFCPFYSLKSYQSIISCELDWCSFLRKTSSGVMKEWLYSIKLFHLFKYLLVNTISATSNVFYPFNKMKNTPSG